MQTSATGLRSRNSPAGFTLLEILIVVVILGIFSALLSIRVENIFSGGDLRLATRMIISEIKGLRGKAAYTRQEQELGLDLDRGVIFPIENSGEDKSSVAGNTETEWEAAQEEVRYGERALPDGVSLEDVVILSKGKIQEGEARIRFFKNGCIERSLIHLKNEKDEVYTLEINPLTGQVKIHDKYIDQKKVE